MPKLEYAIQIAGQLYYQLCKNSKWRISKKLAEQRMRALINTRGK